MKVIFLDCDGVINGYGLFTELIYRIAKKYIYLNYLENIMIFLVYISIKLNYLHKLLRKQMLKLYYLHHGV